MTTNKKYKAIFITPKEDGGSLPDESITLVCDEIPGEKVVEEIENELEGI